MSSFKPRTTNPMGSAYYTTLNPYYKSYNEGVDPPNYGMPNCTAYAYGRWNELALVTDYLIRWPTGDGGDWVQDGIDMGFKSGSSPKLGAAVAWKYEPSGHVAIVEKITDDGRIVISESAYLRPWTGGWVDEYPLFYTEEFSNLESLKNRFSNFVGFLYHPNTGNWPDPEGWPTVGRLNSKQSMIIMTKKNKKKGGIRWR